MDYGIEPGAIALARQIADGELSAVEACDAAIARIEARDGPINAVVVRDFERARAAARKADADLAKGERRPLLGVPITVKESIDIAGLPSSWGFAEHRGHIAREDAHATRRLKAAGAVILGKTNVALALADWQATNPVYGRTVNPWDASRSPGGSSGGSAAALAANMVPLEFGSDIGGSIRVPAHFCGVWGHKPTYGAIPAEGHFFPGTDGADPLLGVIGPMARNADDIALALDLTAVPALPRPRFDDLKGRKLLLLEDNPVCATDAAIAGAVSDAADRAAALGAAIDTHSASMPDLAQHHSHYMKLLLTVLGGDPATPHAAWAELIDHQARAQRQWNRFFEEFDAILAPVLGTCAFPHDDEPEMRNRTLSINGEPTPFGAQFGWVSIATFPGLPATSVPVARDPQGLPINLQVITNRFDDHSAIRLAAMLSSG